MRLKINNYSEFKALVLEGYPDLVTNCVSCNQRFSHTNVSTEAGWRETQISETCETCFDSMFEENGDVKQS